MAEFVTKTDLETSLQALKSDLQADLQALRTEAYEARLDAKFDAQLRDLTLNIGGLLAAGIAILTILKLA